jgi:malonyl-CoA decarboxylase
LDLIVLLHRAQAEARPPVALNLQFLQDLLARISMRVPTQAETAAPPQVATSPLSGLIASCNALMHAGGDIAHMVAARDALANYARLATADRLAFFHVLCDRFGAAADAIHQAYAAYREAESNATLQRLFEACEPHRQELLRRLNRHPGGTFELVKMRADLLELLSANPDLRALDADFKHLFASWFNRGFLVLERIDWNTPAAILEKIIRYEAVHAIPDWNELRKRLDPADRRCYAFFHPAIGDEPLIFVEVALCDEVPNTIDSILTDRIILDPHGADTAVFYSISNCQAGLAGISFGNFLIKQVAQDLRRELPNVHRFVTLSPLPGFAQWLSAGEASEGTGQTPDELTRLRAAGWLHDPAERAALAPTVMRSAAKYLTGAKDGSGRPLDAVARFHLGNGASLHRINWPGDTSDKGLAQAFGVMVNYLYELDCVEQNHEAFTRHRTVVCSPMVRQLVPDAEAAQTSRPVTPFADLTRERR